MSALNCQHAIVHFATTHVGWRCIGCGADVPQDDTTRRHSLYVSAGATPADIRACVLGVEPPSLDAILDLAQSEVNRLALSACIAWVIYDAKREDAGGLADMQHVMRMLTSAIEHYDAVCRTRDTDAPMHPATTV